MGHCSRSVHSFNLSRNCCLHGPKQIYHCLLKHLVLVSLELINEHEKWRSQKDWIFFLLALPIYLFFYSPLRLQDLLRNSQLPLEFLLPFDPRVKAGRILVSFVFKQTGNVCAGLEDCSALTCERINEWDSAWERIHSSEMQPA